MKILRSLVKVLLAIYFLCVSQCVEGHTQNLLQAGLQQLPELVTQLGHLGAVNAIAFSPDGKLLASVGQDKTIKIWDIATRLELRTLSGSPSAINAVAFSSDGSMIAAAGGGDENHDTSIRIWDVGDGQLKQVLSGNSDTVSCLAFSPDNRVLASGSGNEFRSAHTDHIKLWDIASGTETHAISCANAVSILIFSADGHEVVVCKDDGAVIYNVVDGSLLGFVYPISGLGYQLPKAIIPKLAMARASSGAWAFVKHGGDNLFAWISSKGTLLWDASTSQAVQLPQIKGTRISLFSDGAVLKIISVDKTERAYPQKPIGTIKIWDASNTADAPKLLQIIRDGLNPTFYNAIQFLHQGTMFASANGDGGVSLWNTDSGRKLFDFKGNSEFVRDAAFSPSSRIIAAAVGNGIDLWDLSTGMRLPFTAQYDGKRYEDQDSSVDALAYDPKGQSLAVACHGWVTLCSAIDGSVLRMINANAQGHFTANKSHFTMALKFSPDGKELASSGEFSTEVNLWDVATGKLKFALLGHDQVINDIAFSRDGNFIATASGGSGIVAKNGIAIPSYANLDGFLKTDNTIRIWDAHNGKALCQLSLTGPSRGFATIAFNPDGTQLVSAGATDGMLHIWDIVNKKVLHELRGQSGSITAAAWSPDGKTIISGSSDATVCLWDAQTGALLHHMSGHDDQIISIAYSPNGKTFLSSSRDGTIRLWDAHDGHAIAILAPSNTAGSLIAIPDGTYMAPRSALSSVAFRVGNHAYPFEQFDLKLNRPDVVLTRLGFASPQTIQAYKHAYDERLKRMKLSSAVLSTGKGTDFHLPQIALLSSPPITTNEQELTLKIKASDDKYFLDRLNVTVNDVPVYGSKGISLSDAKTKDIEKDIHLELSEGANKVQISALNEQGVESLKETVQISCTAPAQKPDLYVAVVGISTYSNFAYNLNYAAKDAGDLANLFAKQSANFGHIYVKRILNTDATRENILQIKTFLQPAKVDDHVIIFISGHGMLDANLDYYFCTTNMDFDHPKVHGLSYDEIEGMLEDTASRNKLLMMDTCHAGEVDKDEVRLVDVSVADGSAKLSEDIHKDVHRDKQVIGVGNTNTMLQELFTDLRQGSGAVVIAASSGAGYSLESPHWKNGAFTYAVREGLEDLDADANKDNTVQVSELRDYVSARVIALTQGRQQPTTRSENLDNDFAVFDR